MTKLPTARREPSSRVSLSHLRREIGRRNHAELPFPIPHKDISRAAERFLAFTELPDATKMRFRLLMNPRDQESFAGYVKRKKEQVTESERTRFYDKKEYFHYNRYAEERFRTLVLEGDPRIHSFFKAAWKIYCAAEKLTQDILKEFDMEFPGLYAQFFPPDVHPHCYLRFLKYHPEGRGRFLAKGHYDQGAMTLALAESAPGLRIGKNNKTLREITHKDKCALFIPALQLYRLTSEEFRPAWHDVVQKKEDLWSKDTARWAVVFFADPVDKAKIKSKWEERHTPLNMSSSS